MKGSSIRPFFAVAVQLEGFVPLTDPVPAVQARTPIQRQQHQLRIVLSPRSIRPESIESDPDRTQSLTTPHFATTRQTDRRKKEDEVDRPPGRLLPGRRLCLHGPYARLPHGKPGCIPQRRNAFVGVDQPNRSGRPLTALLSVYPRR